MDTWPTVCSVYPYITLLPDWFGVKFIFILSFLFLWLSLGRRTSIVTAFWKEKKKKKKTPVSHPLTKENSKWWWGWEAKVQCRNMYTSNSWFITRWHSWVIHEHFNILNVRVVYVCGSQITIQQLMSRHIHHNPQNMKGDIQCCQIVWF